MAWHAYDDSLFEHWLDDYPTWAYWWLKLIAWANFKESKVRLGNQFYTIGRGQMLTSARMLASRFSNNRKKYDHHQVMDFLKALEADNMIAIVDVGSVPNKKSVITICNFDKFQNGAKSDWVNNSPIDHPNSPPNNSPIDHPNSPPQYYNNTNIQDTGNSSLTHTNACARIEKDEEAYVNEAKSSGEFLEQLQRQFRITDPQRFVSLIDAFNTECKAYDKRHTSHKDFRQKFTWWVGDKLQGTFPSVQVVSSMLNAEGITPDWPLMEAYTGYFDLVRKANLTNYMYQLDILRPRQYADLVMERGFSPQEVWQATTELNNNVRYCRDHQSAYECLITFCQSNRNNPNRR